MRAKVEGHPDLVRDSATGAIINSNKAAFLLHTNMRKKAQDRDDELLQLRAELAELRAIVYSLKKVKDANKQ